MARGQNCNDLRITFHDKARLTFTLEETGETLGDLHLPKRAPERLPAFRRFEAGNHAFSVQVWQAACGDPFPFTHPGALIGVRVESGDKDPLWNNWGSTRDSAQLSTVAWFKNAATNAPETWNFFYGSPKDRNAVIGAENWRDGNRRAVLGIEAGRGKDVRTYDTNAFKGPATLKLVSQGTDQTQPQYRIAIVGTRLRIMTLTSSSLLGLKATGAQTPLTMPLADGYIPLSFPRADDDAQGAGLDASKAGEGYAYLTASFVDAPFGKAE